MRASRVSLRVKPGASATRVVGSYGDRIKVEVSAAPEGGKANAALTAFLAGILGCPRAAVRVVRGESSRDKEVEVEGMEASEVSARLLRAPEASRPLPPGRPAGRRRGPSGP